MAGGPQQLLVLLLGLKAGFPYFSSWWDEAAGDVLPCNTLVVQKLKKRLDGLGLALACRCGVTAPIHLSLITFQLSQPDLIHLANAAVGKKGDQVGQIILVLRVGTRKEITSWHTNGTKVRNGLSQGLYVPNVGQRDQLGG